MKNNIVYGRREMLKTLTSLGAVGVLSPLLGGCVPLTQSNDVIRISGEVLINGKLITNEQLSSSSGLQVTNDSTLQTGSDGSAIFIVGKDAFFLRRNSNIVLNPAKDKNIITGLQLISGAILSVFAQGNRLLRTPTAIIGIKGTGAYLEFDSERTYICTCYGTAQIEAAADPANAETVTTHHHNEPRFIYNADNRKEPAPMINHHDPELSMLEKLVGRVPPWEA
ncbi:MAG: hypothetical protein H8E38_00845 [SAR324 cluster bacterium]|nr:hypothetical protein [SAR324 cluster bacterium]MBL7035980.1 hypothetical protein [SAR324 cluster bacterium]